MFSLSKAFNLQQSNKLDKQAQEALALYAEKIMEKRKRKREIKHKEALAKQYAHKGGKQPKDLYKKEESKRSIAKEMKSESLKKIE